MPQTTSLLASPAGPEPRHDPLRLEPRASALVRLRRMGIDTYQSPIVYMAKACSVCRAEGFEAMSRVEISRDGRRIVATLNVTTDGSLADDEAGLSDVAWKMLDAHEGDTAQLRHPMPLDSLSAVRGKAYGRRLTEREIDEVVRDIAAGNYSDLELAAFVTACAGDKLDLDETIALTRAMAAAGERLAWARQPVLDKHCVGGLPGNRTSLIVVPIVAACGLMIPKTSSRAITSPSGTADTMETLAPVTLDLAALRRVVDAEGGCIAWGGGVRLSPADDVLIRVERPLDFDSPGQLVASVLSKKLSAGSSHILIDVPVGVTAKVRTTAAAQALCDQLVGTGAALGLKVDTMVTDGAQPVGRGIGPALEARDALAVLRNEPGAPVDLRERGIALAARLLELAGHAAPGLGPEVAARALGDGRAWRKFAAICAAQGGLRELPVSRFHREVTSPRAGQVRSFDNRKLSRLAKLAGAPRSAAAGVDLHARLGDAIAAKQPLFTLHADSAGEMAYALDYLADHPEIMEVSP